MSTLRLRDEIAWVNGTNGRVVVLDLDRLDEPPRLLEDTAAAIWRALDEPRTEMEIVRTVAATYSLEPEEIRTDVQTFLSDLTELGLLVDVPDQHP